MVLCAAGFTRSVLQYTGTGTYMHSGILSGGHLQVEWYCDHFGTQLYAPVASVRMSVNVGLLGHLPAYPRASSLYFDAT